MLEAKALLLGAVIGALFSAFGFDVPAPRTAAGIAGVVGLWLGYLLVVRIQGG